MRSRFRHRAAPRPSLRRRRSGASLPPIRLSYGKVTLGLAGKGHADIAPPESVDLVVSFRNVHNWMADQDAPDMFAAFFKALKHGGILGIEEHRGNRVRVQDPRAADGYVNQETMISLATSAGFVLVASSEMNANPKDTANWPRGVWTLPPDLALGDTDRAKFLAIGEADNVVHDVQKALSSGRRAADFGAPRGIRTPDPRVRSPILYPAELEARWV